MKINSQIELCVRTDISPYRHPRLLEALEKDLTFENPKFKEAERLGFSTFSIPRTLKLLYQSPAGTWYIPRGHVRTVLKHFPDEKIEHLTCDAWNQHVLYFNEDFSLDERQLRCLDAIDKKKQGLILAATSSGKSAIILAAIAKLQQNALIIVNRQVLLDQLLEDAEKYLSGCSIGVLNGRNKEVGQVTFAIDKTLQELLRSEDEKARNNPHDPELLRNKFGLIIVDEVHVVATPTMTSILSRLPAKHRYGLTGTLNQRKDKLDFLVYAQFGEVIAEVSKDEIIEAGRAVPYTVHVLETGAEVTNGPDNESPTTYWKRIDTELHASEQRENVLFEAVRASILAGETPAVGFRYVEPCKRLVARLAEAGLPVSLLIGGVKDPRTVCTDVQEGKTKGIVATYGTFSTGVNIPKLDHLFIASPSYSNQLLLNQLRGRILRNNPGKEKSKVTFLFDEYVFPRYKLNRVVRSLEK